MWGNPVVISRAAALCTLGAVLLLGASLGMLVMAIVSINRPEREVCTGGTAELLRDYRARLIAVSALLLAPVNPGNLRQARDLISPLYGDALRDLQARRQSAKLAVK